MLQNVIKALIVVLALSPFISRTLFDIQFSFAPQDDFLYSLLELLLWVFWLLMLICACTMLAGYKKVKVALLSFAICIACFFTANYMIKELAPGEHLYLMQNLEAYKDEIKITPKIRHEFEWGSYGMSFSASGSRKLIYDPSD